MSTIPQGGISLLSPTGTGQTPRLKSDQSQDVYRPSNVNGSKVLSAMVPMKLSFWTFKLNFNLN